MNSNENKAEIPDRKVPALATEKKTAGISGKTKVYLWAGIPVLAILFYTAESIYWFNRDVREIAPVYGWAIQIERECKRRDDLLPNLINITKEYAKHERKLFEYASTMNSRLGPDALQKNPSTANNQELLSKFIALAQQYPDLKAVQSYQDLMDMIETTEDRIAKMRDNYIRAVEDYNICNQTFWCPFFTAVVNIFCPMPTFIDYYYYKSGFTGEWPKLGAPVMLQKELTEKEINELKNSNPYGEELFENNNKGTPPPPHGQQREIEQSEEPK